MPPCQCCCDTIRATRLPFTDILFVFTLRIYATIVDEKEVFVKRYRVHKTEILQTPLSLVRLWAMFVTDGKTNYDSVFGDLLTAFWNETAQEKKTKVTFFQDLYTVKEDGIYTGAGKIDSIGGNLILRYLFRASDEKIRNEWVPYREFKDGSNFAAYIKSRIENIIAREFSGRREILIKRLETLGGKPYPFEARPDISIIVHAFPAIPILSVFWDQDEEFPASFQFLFDRSAPSFLDMESLAVLLHYIHMKITE